MNIPFATGSFSALRATHDSNPNHVAYAVHFALPPSQIGSLPEEWAIAVDGDGWECWGDPFNQVDPSDEASVLAGLDGDLNDGMAYHIVMYSTNAGSSVARILSRYSAFDLVPMKQDRARGNIIVTTDFDDWSERRDPEYLTVNVGGVHS